MLATCLTGKEVSLIEKETSHVNIYRPLRSRRKERQDFVFLPNRNGRFDKAIGPSGVLENRTLYWNYSGVTHAKNDGCFFESSVPIRKRLCGLCALAVQSL